MGAVLRVLPVVLLILAIVGAYTLAVFRLGQYKERRQRERWSPLVDTALEWRSAELRHGDESVTARQILSDFRRLVDQEEDWLKKELRQLND
jgi:hypothetical protein